MNINVKLLTPTARVPKYSTGGAAAADLYADLGGDGNYVNISPRSNLLIKTGVSMEVPPGFKADVTPRSGLALKNQITVTNSPGIIDSDYRGNIGVILENNSTDTFTVTHGDRIAQISIIPVVQADFNLSEDLSNTDRGEGGFGHTGV